MWETIFSEALNYGIFAAMFVALIIYVLRNTSQREKKYQEMITQLHESLKVIEQIQIVTKEISTSLIEMKNDLRRNRNEQTEKVA